MKSLYTNMVSSFFHNSFSSLVRASTFPFGHFIMTLCVSYSLINLEVYTSFLSWIKNCFETTSYYSQIISNFATWRLFQRSMVTKKDYGFWCFCYCVPIFFRAIFYLYTSIIAHMIESYESRKCRLDYQSM